MENSKEFSQISFLDRNSVNDFTAFLLKSKIGLYTEINEYIEEYISNFIKPNLVYSPQLTEIAIKNAKDKVLRNIGIVNENERIVAKHDRISPRQN